MAIAVWSSTTGQGRSGVTGLPAWKKFCRIQVAAWAAQSRHTHRVRAAFLAAPPDVERDDIRQMIHNWSPVPLQRLPFPSVLLASDNDAFCSGARSEFFSAAWGSTYVPVGSLGHLNSDSHLGDWPQGHHVLLGLGQLE
jgi:uncharacterized protein